MPGPLPGVVTCHFVVPAEWMEVPAARDVVEPRRRTTPAQRQNSGREAIVCSCSSTGRGSLFSSDPLLRRCGCGVAVLDFTDVFAPSTAEEVFSLVSNKPFPDLRFSLGSRRFATLRVKPSGVDIRP